MKARCTSFGSMPDSAATAVALTAATQPSIEEIALGALPGLPKIAVHWPLIDFECGPVGGADDFIEWFFKADRGELEPFVLVVEGSIPNEAIKKEGYWCGFGNNPATGQPMTTSEWLDRLAPRLWPCWLPGRAPATAGSMPWPATPPGQWGCRTIWAGAGSPRPDCPSCAYRAARPIPTTCPRPTAFLPARRPPARPP